MFQRIGYTWTMMKASLDVLRKDKELLAFPLLSGIACLLVLASFIAPLLTNTLPIPAKNAPPVEQAVFYGYCFLFYFCNYFVIVFFNTAVVACAALRFEGHDPTLGDGLRAAVARLPQIVGWALLSATVGLILRIIEDRSEKVGRFVAGLLGAAWTLVSFLAVPVLVLEKKGPFAALSGSASLLKKTWGEQLVGGFSFGLIFFLLGIPGWIGVVGGIFLLVSAAALPILAYGLLALGILYLVVLALVQSVLQTVFQTALYLYARDGRAPAGFTEELLGTAVAQGGK